MRLLLIAVTVSLFIACGSNDASVKTVAADSKDNSTMIHWLDSGKNYGNIKEGQKLALAFRFKNTGNKPLVIQSVTPTCGCTVADYPKQPIAAGGEGEITGIFDSMGKEGLQHKHLTVRSNSNPAEQDISFEVNVIPLPKGKEDAGTN